ncbi:MAG: hypothetical protein R3265_05230 [Hyphomonas sp.]|nr:hypothetical protein [Hyphomonas sp.]
MSNAQSPSSAKALEALLGQRERFGKLAEKDFAAATMLLVKKLMISAGQTTEDMKDLRDTVGHDLFETTLKSLTAHQARQLARRMDRTVPDLEVSTAGAACAWIRGLMNGTHTASAAPAKDTAEDTPPDDTPPPPKNAYFGRKAFRTGG